MSRESSVDGIAAPAVSQKQRRRNDVLTAVQSFLLRRRREIELVALGVFLAGVGVLVSLVLSKDDNQGIEIIDAGTAGENSQPRESGQGDLLADVAGAVISPGIYRLPANSRFADALIAAGGLSASADRNWVSRHLNLAQNITDGIKIYIPAVGDPDIGYQKSDSRIVGDSDNPKSDIRNPTSESFISINTATLTELDTLWGVGEARAKAIIAGRPYTNIEELITRKILPKNVLEKNRERLSL